MSVENQTRGAFLVQVPMPPPALPTAAVQQQLKRVLTQALPLVRYRLMRLGPSGLVGLALIVAAAGAVPALLLPMRQAVRELHTELAGSAHARTPLREPATAGTQFLNSLPTRHQVPAVLGTLVEQAAAAGVVLDQGRYSYMAPTANRLARYSLDFPVKGDYANLRGFIDRALKAVPALGLDKLRVERKNVGDMAISAEVGFVLYLRGS
jgi:hypothetical protein